MQFILRLWIIFKFATAIVSEICNRINTKLDEKELASRDERVPGLLTAIVSIGGNINENFKLNKSI